MQAKIVARQLHTTLSNVRQLSLHVLERLGVATMSKQSVVATEMARQNIGATEVGIGGAGGGGGTDDTGDSVLGEVEECTNRQE